MIIFRFLFHIVFNRLEDSQGPLVGILLRQQFFNGISRGELIIDLGRFDGLLLVVPEGDLHLIFFHAESDPLRSLCRRQPAADDPVDFGIVNKAVAEIEDAVHITAGRGADQQQDQQDRNPDPVFFAGLILFTVFLSGRVLRRSGRRGAVRVIQHSGERTSCAAGFSGGRRHGLLRLLCGAVHRGGILRIRSGCRRFFCLRFSFRCRLLRLRSGFRFRLF